MKIGVPKEIKTLEGRIALIPAAAGQLVAQGHEVFVEKGAGLLSGYGDAEYRDVGVNIVDGAEALYEDVFVRCQPYERCLFDRFFEICDDSLFIFSHLVCWFEMVGHIN